MSGAKHTKGVDLRGGAGDSSVRKSISKGKSLCSIVFGI